MANDITDAIIDHIKDYVKPNFPWQKEVHRDSEANWFYALLGSPNGSGVAYLLLDHKRALGKKTIAGITLFCYDEELFCDILFEVEDLQETAEGGGPCETQSADEQDDEDGILDGAAGVFNSTSLPFRYTAAQEGTVATSRRLARRKLR